MNEHPEPPAPAATVPPDPRTRTVARSVWADDVEEMLPGRVAAVEEGSTWEAYQDDGTFPAWL